MKFFMAGLGALLLTAGTASADFTRGYIFQCHYSGTVAKAEEHCRVLANVCTFRLADTVRNRAEPMATETAGPCVDLMRTTCSGAITFEGPAEHLLTRVQLPWDTLEFQVIKGKANQQYPNPPMIRYSSQDPGTANPFYISSWMKIGDDEIKGYCEVHHPPTP